MTDPAPPPSPPPAVEPDAAAFDALVETLGRWVEAGPEWTPARRARTEWEAVAPRLDRARRELSRILVVGVIGGTGTGKSTLVNALAGAEVTVAGDVARPTTVAPVVVAAPDVDLSWLPLEAFGGRLVRSDSAAVANVVLIDCPDPDTQADHAADTARPRPSDANRNRDLLEAVLPACDVLVLAATAQKYKSWIVAREVAAFAPGRPLLFVQTHASRDPDIRVDWRRELEAQGFDVPRIFRVDGVEAAARSAAGLEPEAGFRELLEAIDGELTGRAARRVRRTGAVDLAAWFTRQAGTETSALAPAVAALAAGVASERRRLESLVVRTVGERLRSDRAAWQRLIADDVVGRWHGGPFASFLHVVAALGGLWSRVRRGTGFVDRLLAVPPAAGAGHADGWRTLEDLGLAAGEVEQSRSVLSGLAARAAIGEPLVGRARLDSARASPATAAVADGAGRLLAAGIDRLVADRRARVGGRFVHWSFEALFGLLLVTVLGRAGWSFFHGTLWEGRPVSGVGFIQEGIVWLVLWGLLLRWLVFALVRLGLDRDVTALVRGVDGAGLVDPLLADFTTASATVGEWSADGARLAAEAERLATVCGGPAGLGRLRRAGP